MATRPRRRRATPEALRPPTQNRSRETLERVLAAGEQLLIEEGWDGFTVQEVSRRSKVSIGSIYARAPSKEALILAVYDRAVERIAAENAAALNPDEHWHGMAPRDLIIGATRELAGQMLRHQETLRVFMNRSPVDREISERGNVEVRRLASRYEALLLRHRDAYTHPDPDLAIEIAFRMVFAPMSRRISFGPAWGAYRNVEDDQLVEQLGRAVAAYLLEPPASEHENPGG
jgi:AcrR family transcriptional regulator